MIPEHQAENIAQAIHLGIITEQEAIDLLIAIKQRDQKTIEKLRVEHVALSRPVNSKSRPVIQAT